MQVWILHRDVDYEFGHVMSVHATEEKAKEALEEATKTKHNPGFFGGTELGIDRNEMDIEEWEVGE